MLGAPGPGIRVVPDRLDSTTFCPIPGSLLSLRGTPRCPHVPFFCHVANAHLGAQDEALEQGKQRGRFGWGWVVVDEIGGRGRRGGGEEEDIVQDAALQKAQWSSASELAIVTCAWRNAP